MFGGRFSSSIGLLGIDCASRSIRMLQLREEGNELHVVGAAEVGTPPRLSPASSGGAEGAASAESGEPIADSPCDRRSSESDGSKSVTGESAASDVLHDETLTAAQASDLTTVKDARGGTAGSSGAADAALIERLRAALVAGGFTGRRCVISLPRCDVRIQSVRLPKMPDSELQQAASWEASQRFGFDRDAMEVQALRTGASLQSGDSREEVLLIAASHAAIYKNLQPILNAGLRPVAIDTAFAALNRIFSRGYRRESDQQLPGAVRMVLEIGYTGTTAMILRGNQISFCKPIAIGGRQFDEAVAEHLQLDIDDAGELRANRIQTVRRRNVEPVGLDGTRPDSAADLLRDGDGSTSQPYDISKAERRVYEAVRPLINDLVKEVTLCLRYYGVTFRGRPPSQIVLAGGDALEPNLTDVLSGACKIPVVLDDDRNTLKHLHDQVQAKLAAAAPGGVGGIGGRPCSPALCWAVTAGLSLRNLNGAAASAQGRDGPGLRGAVMGRLTHNSSGGATPSKASGSSGGSGVSGAAA